VSFSLDPPIDQVNDQLGQQRRGSHFFDSINVVEGAIGQGFVVAVGCQRIHGRVRLRRSAGSKVR